MATPASAANRSTRSAGVAATVHAQKNPIFPMIYIRIEDFRSRVWIIPQIYRRGAAAFRRYDGDGLDPRDADEWDDHSNGTELRPDLADRLCTDDQLGVAGSVIIKFSANSGSTYPVTLATVPAASGSYAWTVIQPATAAARIKVEAAADAAVFDVSEKDFAIPTANITGVHPSGGDPPAFQGVDYTVTWSSLGLAGNVTIEVSVDGGSTFQYTLATCVPNNGRRLINFATPSSGAARIRITSCASGGALGTSATDFLIIN